MRTSDDITYPETLGERIIRYRNRRRVTVTALAQILRTAPGTIVNWQKDRTVPKYRDVMALADALDVDAELLDPDIRNRCFDTDTPGEAAS